MLGWRQWCQVRAFAHSHRSHRVHRIFYLINSTLFCVGDRTASEKELSCLVKDFQSKLEIAQQELVTEREKVASSVQYCIFFTPYFTL